MREISPGRALLNATLAVGVLALATWGVFKVAQRHWVWQPTFRAEAAFAIISGLALGDKVRLQGMEAGVVESIQPPVEPGGPIRVGLRIDARLHSLIRTDAVASIAMQNAVGPKVIEISPGKPNAQALPDGGQLLTTEPLELSDLFKSTRESLNQLASLTRETEQGMKEFNAIAGAINRGEGTLGKLVRDDAAYRQFMSLAERGEKAVSALDDNLSAVKGFWPISSYIKERGFDDTDRILYRPNSTREGQVFNSADLFEPDTAIVSENGAAQLDQFVTWFKDLAAPESAEIVIAAFATSAQDQNTARILTQDQARAVKNYLETKHRLFDLGFFRQRKVAAVGFGTREPKPEPGANAAGENSPPPSNRVEILIFTPKN